MSNLQKDEEMLLPWLSEEQVERCKDGLKGRWQRMKIDISKLDTRIYREGERCPLQYVECDECGEMFSLNLKERNLPARGKYSKERYFVCPVCKHEYICARWDKRGEIVKE